MLNAFNAVFYLVKTISDLYLLTFLFRFILQWVRGDFYNPLSQFIIKVTNPLVVPARRIIPSVGEVDVPTLVVLVLLECIVTWLLLTLAGTATTVETFALYVVLRLVSLTLWLYTISILVYVILSFFAQAAYSPIAMLLGNVVGPVLRPVRRILPPIGGLDLSPWLVLVVLQALMVALQLPPELR
jgi:YggT family protein